MVSPNTKRTPRVKLGVWNPREHGALVEQKSGAKYLKTEAGWRRVPDGAAGEPPALQGSGV
jgi:hypothetical protein